MQRFKEKIQQMEWFERHLFLAAAATACLVLGCVIHGEQFLLMPQVSFLMGLLTVAIALPLTTWLPEPIKEAAAEVYALIDLRTIISLTAITLMLVTGIKEPTDGFVLQVFELVYKASVVIVFLGGVQVMLVTAITGKYAGSVIFSMLIMYAVFSLAVVWSVGRYGDTVKQFILEASPDQLVGIIAMILTFFAYLCAESFSRTPQLSGKGIQAIQTLGYAKYGHAGMVSDKPVTIKTPDSNK